MDIFDLSYKKFKKKVDNILDNISPEELLQELKENGLEVNRKEKKMPKLKIKLKKDFEEILNTIYEVYVLEDDKKLDAGAKELKKHYKYVIEDMESHDCLEIRKERRTR